MDHLTRESARQEKVVAAVRSMLQARCGGWFRGDSKESVRAVPTALLQHCIWPRALLSAEDALFCAHFVLTMNAIGTPHFSTLSFFGKCLGQVPQMLFGSTDLEVMHVTFFIDLLLREQARWAASEEASGWGGATSGGWDGLNDSISIWMSRCGLHGPWFGGMSCQSCHEWQ